MSDTTVVDTPSAPAQDAPPPPPKISVSFTTPVKIMIDKKDKDDTWTPIQGESPRNITVLLKAINRLTAGLTPPEQYTLKLVSEGNLPDGNTVEVTLAEGALPAVVKAVSDNVVVDEHAATILMQTVRGMLEPSTMRGVLLVAVFEDQKPLSFAILNKTMGDTLTAEDINMLAYQAASNLTMFKDAMRKQGHTFPDDNPLIVPAGGMDVRNLKRT
jgi:hypothetical protein